MSDKPRRLVARDAGMREEEHPVFGKIVVISTAMVDEETGVEMTNEGVFTAHANLAATGYHVKLRLSAPVEGWPMFGVVAEIDDEAVTLATDDGPVPVPRALFLDLYEVD